MNDLLTLPALQGAFVFGGAGGLDRSVTGVNVMEVPDIEAYVAPGELLLTSAYPVREHPERLVEMLATLTERGLAALAITPVRYLGHLPDRLSEEADRLGFPVIVLPDGTSFKQIIGAVLAVVLADYDAEPIGAEAIRERLTGVALAGGGLEEIARTLAGALDRKVLIVDEAGQPLGHATPDGDGDTLAGATLDPTEPSTPWIFPITVAGTPRGRILVDGDSEPSLGQRRLIRQSCFAAGMHVAQVLAGVELDRRLRVLFLEELVSGSSFDEPTLQQRTRLFGWDLAGQRVILLTRCSGELTDAAVQKAASAALPNGSLAWPRGGEVVALVALPDVAPHYYMDLLAARWRAALVDVGATDVTVAVGSAADNPAQLAASHSTARDALRIAVHTEMQTARFDELELERLLLAVPRAMLVDFVDRNVGALVGQDQRDSSDLCLTLEAYLGYGNAAEAARTMYIHYNTMKHRLARISELTGADLHDPRTRLTLAMAMQIRNLL
ncbi:PucR family transcriptional regulator ligand-binding domain-containing protein [Mycobacterium sp. 21AC1]|uniref:PucR family transcriptional regulator n=1 Tax=[Mycobacterium] appelbergii TaxID=2939269 RepID=UPI0029392C38|nr:PucR family transcriptional regulator ligand-binding domain-containing protein [Mycobacterium sp. 21AC1]MDV3124898.1 PucR family transcriptional regulator ligand-binding domain-containing protein [Mycobacterium sp. 21AC1]